MRGIAAGVLRPAVVALGIIVVTSLATGWLYWARGAAAGWPGPRVHDALPLDELPGHDSVPLVVYLAVSVLAAVLLGLVARAAGLDRLTAGLSLAAGTGGWLLAVGAFSLFVVRQVPATVALRDAGRLQGIYLAAALAGAAGALLGRRVRPGGLTPSLLGWLVAAGGLVDLVSALVPHMGHTLHLLAPFAPDIVFRTAHVLLVPAGVLLLITSRGLIRRSRRAWQLAVGLLGLSVVLQLLRGPDYPGAILTCLVALALLARRDDFRFGGDPEARPSALLRLAGALAFAFAFGVTALWIHRTAAGLPFTFPMAVMDTARAVGGGRPADVDLLSRGFREWFPLSVISIVAIGAIWAVVVWLRPWRQRLFTDAGRFAQAAGIVREWGADSLAPFTLRADKEWFITGRTLVAYRVIRGIALVSGDPVGPPEETGAALDSFLAHAREHGWHTAVMGASERLLDTYRERGLHPVYHGDEAVIDVTGFSLEGRPMRAVRQAVHRVERQGFRSEVVRAGDVSPVLRAELTAVEQSWLRGGVRKGFTMELDSLFRLGGEDALFVIGRGGDGRVNGFLHLAVCGASRSLSLSTMPRWRDTPNGFTSWLITQTVGWARCHGFAQLSLNFSPFAGLLTSEADLPAAARLRRRALLRLKGVLALQLDNLHQFNSQFGPEWQSRYVILQAWADLPRVAVAAMAAEGYLPHAGLIRGRGWARPPEPAAARDPGAGGEPAADRVKAATPGDPASRPPTVTPPARR